MNECAVWGSVWAITVCFTTAGSSGCDKLKSPLLKSCICCVAVRLWGSCSETMCSLLHPAQFPSRVFNFCQNGHKLVAINESLLSYRMHVHVSAWTPSPNWFRLPRSSPKYKIRRAAFPNEREWRKSFYPCSKEEDQTCFTLRIFGQLGEISYLHTFDKCGAKSCVFTFRLIGCTDQLVTRLLRTTLVVMCCFLQMEEGRVDV